MNKGKEILFAWRDSYCSNDGPRPTVRLVLWSVSRFMDTKGEGAFPSITTLQEISGLSRRGVLHALRTAKEQGWLNWHQEKSSTYKGGKRNVDHVLFSTGATHALPDSSATEALGSDGFAANFRDFKQAFPRRGGSQPWKRAEKAIHARLLEGHSWEEIAAGVAKYGTFCEATGKIGTEIVMQAATFCGPDKHFLNAWGIPTSGQSYAERMAAAARDS